MDVYACPRCKGVPFTLSTSHTFATCNGCGLAVDIRFTSVQPMIVTGYHPDDVEPSTARGGLEAASSERRRKVT